MRISWLFWRPWFYRYRSDCYADTFLAYDAPSDPVPSKADSVVYCFWTGDNPMTKNRTEALESMHRSIGVPIVLVTQENLQDFILQDNPLHPAFEYLSLVHRSDYLRCYFMNFYGGGYSDIKRHDCTWMKDFERLNRSEKWFVGYREIGRHGVASVKGKIGRDIRANWRKLIGNCAYICKPQTPFTQEWFAELHRRLDEKEELLRKSPGNILGDNPGYPFKWTEILGDIFHPLCLKYSGKRLFSKRIRPYFKEYR